MYGGAGYQLAITDAGGLLVTSGWGGGAVRANAFRQAVARFDALRVSIFEICALR